MRTIILLLAFFLGVQAYGRYNFDLETMADKKQKYCGDKFELVLFVLCKGEYYEPSKRSEVVDLEVPKRFWNSIYKRQVDVNECCRDGCSKSQLRQMYCKYP